MDARLARVTSGAVDRTRASGDFLVGSAELLPKPLGPEVPLDEGTTALRPEPRTVGRGEHLTNTGREPLGRGRDEKRQSVVEELGVGRDPGGHEGPAGSEVRVELEWRVLASRPGRSDDVCSGEELGKLGGRALAREDATGGVMGSGLHSLDVRRLAAHEEEGNPGTQGCRVHEELDPLVRLEIAGVENHGSVTETELCAQRPTWFGVERPAGIDERGVLDLEDRCSRRTTPNAVTETLAHGDRSYGVPQSVVLQDVGQPEERAAGGEARITELVRNGGVDVHHERDPEQTGERGDEVGRLLHRMDGVRAREGDSEHGLDEEWDVEEDLGEGWPRLHVTYGQPQAAVVNEAGDIDVRSLGEAQQLHLVTELRQRSNHREDVQGSPPDLEEGLRSENEDPQRFTCTTETGTSTPFVSRGAPQWLRNRSASMAAMQPVPAAVIAWR